LLLLLLLLCLLLLLLCLLLRGHSLCLLSIQEAHRRGGAPEQAASVELPTVGAIHLNPLSTLPHRHQQRQLLAAALLHHTAQGRLRVQQGRPRPVAVAAVAAHPM
jgi:hypothetical protein